MQTKDEKNLKGDIVAKFPNARMKGEGGVCDDAEMGEEGVNIFE